MVPTLCPAELASELASSVERMVRSDGSEFLALADGSPDWMRDAIRAAHENEPPGDWRYEVALRAAMALKESPETDPSELASEVAETVSTVCTSELLAWYAEQPGRLAYADDAREELGSGSADDIGGDLHCGMWLAAQRGALALLSALGAQ